ncbi:RNA recognition motif domain containing protein [Theileria equi strain WA]|uniref:RNA recognition motif domain containing protein n=1 Tax=Theileria equi strain WA TaxID=1537102 RepID=L1LCT1_THEEQ|nr:RNA recognition motif domain containing protein [Theileria equi strain WA]EKX73055.1 RNA recognition motif domain containing protein [Theileria equi strain WA]|eukprot:XP_004832507.1 RNA recognition motif domain containing protein [Theileria equi strain WA]
MGSRFESMEGKRLYVGNLNEDTTTDQIDSLFSRFGILTNVWVARRPPGFAFVTFEDPRDASDAIAELNGREFQGTTLRVEYCKGARPSRPFRTRERDPHAFPMRNAEFVFSILIRLAIGGVDLEVCKEEKAQVMGDHTLEIDDPTKMYSIMLHVSSKL